MRSTQLAYSDKVLVGLAQKGNLKAYNQLLRKYHHKIKGVIYHYIDDPANVNDLVQDVFLKIFRYLPNFKENCQFSTWMYRITKNTIKNHFRATDLRSESESQYAHEVNFLTSSTSPEHDLMNMEIASLVQKAINRLSEELSICYRMHLFEGQSYEHIALKMNCPIGTVRSRIYRARKLVIEQLRYKPTNIS